MPAPTPRPSSRPPRGTLMTAGLGVLLVLFASLCLAASPTLARLAYDHGSDPSTVSLVRFIIAGGGFMILLGLQRERVPADRSIFRASVIIGICYALQTLAYLSSVRYVTVPVAVLVFFTFPIIAALLVRLVDGIPLSADKIIAVIVAFCGVALATGASPQWPDPRGVGLAFLAAVGTAFYIVYGGGISRRTGPILINALSMTVAAVVLAVNAALFAPPALPDGPVGWIGLIAGGITFLIGILAFFTALSLMETLKATLLANSEPFFAIAIAFVILGDRLTTAQAAGAILVIIGVMVPQIWASQGHRSASRRQSS